MKKFLPCLAIVGLCFSDAFAEKPSFVGSFKGFYFGPSLALGKTRIGVTQQRYKKTRAMIGGLLGYGHLLSSDLYIGGEAGLFHDTFSEKKAGQRIEKKGQLEGILRLGHVLQNNFLPYIGLGGSYSRYRMESATQKQTFHSADLIAETGVDVFVKPHLTIRSSVRYQRGLYIQKNSPAVSIEKKPQSLFLKIGVSYIF